MRPVVRRHRSQAGYWRAWNLSAYAAWLCIAGAVTLLWRVAPVIREQVEARQALRNTVIVSTPAPADLREEFGRQAQRRGLKVSGSDLQIDPVCARVARSPMSAPMDCSVSLIYEREVPLWGRYSLLFKFAHAVKAMPVEGGKGGAMKVAFGNRPYSSVLGVQSE